MLIRPATPNDLNACLALSANSQTDHVWQMEAREEHDTISVRFHPVRLPRVMHVAYPRQRDDLLACWERGATVLVATDESDTQQVAEDADVEARPLHVLGYCQLESHPWQGTGWISHLIVDRRLRRHGVGKAMLQASIAWGREQKLERLMVAVHTKNYPGICFCQKHGFAFCGFNDHYFANRDIALFFTAQI